MATIRIAITERPDGSFEPSERIYQGNIENAPDGLCGASDGIWGDNTHDAVPQR